MIFPCLSFNPRAHGGRDTAKVTRPSSGLMFQSTRPRGARLRRRPGIPNIASFNPRAHGGRDLRLPALVGLNPLVSIHAPTGGATLSPPYSTNTALVFQSTRPRGARRVRGLGRRGGAGVSIHAPTGGATDNRLDMKGGMQFQSTRPRGARLLSFCSILM